MSVLYKSSMAQVICVYNRPIMEQTSELIDFQLEQASQLQRYNSSQLQQVSSMARESLGGFLSDKELSFQQTLHLEVQVEKVREIIFQCNIELTDFIVQHARGNHYQATTSFNTQRQSGLSDRSQEQQHRQWERKLKVTLQSFKKTLTLREVQLTMLLFINQHKKDNNFKELYLKNYGMLPSFIIPPEFIFLPINLSVLQDLFRKEIQYLHTYQSQIKNLKKIQTLKEQELINPIIERMKISHSKIRTIGEIFPWACIKDKDDLFSQSPCSSRWQRLTATRQIIHISLADHHTLSQSFQAIKKNLTLVNAAMSIIDRHKISQSQDLTQKMAKIIVAATQVLKVAIFKSEARHEAAVMMAQPEESLTKQIWNLPQSKRFRDFIELSLPSISFSQVLYLPRKLKYYFDGRYYQHKKLYFPMLHVENLSSYWQNLLTKQCYDDAIRVRINCPYQLVKRQQEVTQSSKNILAYFTYLFGKEKKAPKEIVFHIHGGGFISMSSFIHQTYTRLWATNLHVPIISVDYGKAPDRPFPMGLYDCFEAYCWTLMVFKQIYHAQPQKIILVGDSAGGNLCAALTTLLLQWKLPAPSGLVLVYPALNLNFNDYTPSLLTALNDMILPHTFLKICQKAYLKNSHCQPDKDPFISPILTPGDILAQYPRTQILVGNKDPFHDDCCRFVEQLNSAKKGNAKLTVFEEFPHGFLQFDIRMFPNEYAREATKIVQRSLRHLLQS